jgi:hypothetical protein
MVPSGGLHVKQKTTFFIVVLITMKNVVFWDIKPSSYLTGDTLLLRCKYQPVNVV